MARISQATHFCHLLMKAYPKCVCVNSKTCLAKNDYFMVSFNVIVLHRLSKPLRACFCFSALPVMAPSDLIVNRALHGLNCLKLGVSMSCSRLMPSFWVTLLHLGFANPVLCWLGSHTSEAIAGLVILFRILCFYPLYYWYYFTINSKKKWQNRSFED